MSAYDTDDLYKGLGSLSEQRDELLLQSKAQRYHGTGRAKFNPDGVTEAIDAIFKEMEKHIGHQLRLVNVTVTPHPIGELALVTVIAEDIAFLSEN